MSVLPLFGDVSSLDECTVFYSRRCRLPRVPLLTSLLVPTQRWRALLVFEQAQKAHFLKSWEGVKMSNDT